MSAPGRRKRMRESEAWPEGGLCVRGWTRTAPTLSPRPLVPLPTCPQGGWLAPGHHKPGRQPTRAPPPPAARPTLAPRAKGRVCHHRVGFQPCLQANLPHVAFHKVDLRQSRRRLASERGGFWSRETTCELVRWRRVGQRAQGSCRPSCACTTSPGGRNPPTHRQRVLVFLHIRLRHPQSVVVNV